MADRLVCNINFFLYIRFIFGFYHDFQTSKRVRWLARWYCCLICASLITFMHGLKNYTSYPIFLIYVVTVEYFLYVLLSLLKSNKYLLQYYQKTPFIDTNESSFKSMRVCLIGYISVVLLMRLSGFINNILSHWEENAIQHSFALLDSVMWFVLLIGRLPLLFVFSLMYTRVKLMRQTLERNNFDYRNQGNNHPRRYIQMYELIMDGLEECDGPLKQQLLVFIVFSGIFCLTGTLEYFYYMKNYNDSGNLNTFELLWFMVENVLGCSPLILSAILADLVTMEIQEMLGIIIERRITCNNEREYEEIQKLFQFLKTNPFGYSLWRVVPLNVYTLFSFVSFSVTTIIAILQVQGWVA